MTENSGTETAHGAERPGVGSMAGFAGDVNTE